MNTHRVPIGEAHLTVRDQGQGPALVFGHSLTFDSTIFDAQAEALSEPAEAAPDALRVVA